MQQKEYETVQRQVIPPAGVNSLVIENTGLSKLNFHGMRFMGRIMTDNAEPADAYASGFITLMCIPNDQIAIPNLQTEADLNDSNSFIIAVQPWQLHQRVNTIISTAGVFDFEFAPKTSRSCMKGGKIVGQVTNNSPVADIVLTALMGSFETF